MSFSKTLSHLVHHQSSHIGRDQIAFLASPEARAAAEAADLDIAASVATMVDALHGLALDPLRGSEVHHFVTDWGDEWGFNVHFHRLAHFIACFSVPKSSPLAVELVTPIEANLQGRMFKAAQMDRRLHSRFIKLRTRMSARGAAVYKAYVREHAQPGVYGAARDDVAAMAEQLSEQATAARDASLHQRQQLVSNAAMPAFAGRCWSNWAADRLVAVLPKFVPEHV